MLINARPSAAYFCILPGTRRTSRRSDGGNRPRRRTHPPDHQGARQATGVGGVSAPRGRRSRGPAAARNPQRRRLHQGRDRTAARWRPAAPSSARSTRRSFRTRSRSRAARAVEFPNGDPFFHNVFSLSRAANFNLGRYARGQTRGREFTKAGTVKVYCDIHSHMSATILVFDHPYFAIPERRRHVRAAGGAGRRVHDGRVA